MRGNRKSEPSIWSEGRALLIIAPLFSLMFLYQNCAPAQIQSRELSSDQAAATEMSKVTVTLQHDSALTLSDVELVADDVMTTIDQVPGPDADAMPISKAGSGSVVLNATAIDASSYSLELPRGSQKIIVARAKSHDPKSNAVASYYGNVVITANEAVGEVTIQLVAVH
ncbi:hypothetical protein BH10BDE1_BH10BDE1_02220 [soil metagenome]